jgi:protein tyrosine phosphatase (PTP) superfamily phosphohydrolase (DUF442 family)/outer membrane protein assembly factor BamB
LNRKKIIIFVLIAAAIAAGGFFLVYQKNHFNVSNESLGRSPASFAKNYAKVAASLPEAQNKDFALLWYSDFDNNRVMALTPDNKIAWEQNMDAAPIPAQSYNVHTEYVSLAPNGNLIVSDGDGMMVQEIDRSSHALLWQFGKRSVQGYTDSLIHQPDRSFKLNDHEVLINDGNNRRVIIVDQTTGEIVWQYGHTLEMSSSTGYLRGNTAARPINDGKQIIITDTLENKFMIVDRATKQILWQYKKPDAKWLEHVFPTGDGTFVLEDRQKNEVFEVDINGKVLWTLSKLADGSTLKYPTDTIKLPNGDILVAEAGRYRIIEVTPQTGLIVKTWNISGYVTTIAIDYQAAPQGNEINAGKTFNLVGPRNNLNSSSTPADYGFWSFAIPVPGILSRSGQPTLTDFQWLRQKGWKSVVDLRVDGERDEVGDDTKIEGFDQLGFNYLALPMPDGSPPTNEQAEKFLNFVTDPVNQPAHVHCRGGIGRTGVMVALYRYSVQGWPWLRAVAESILFQGGISDSQKNWLERWVQSHDPGSWAK